MSPEQIDAVRSSFALLQPVAPQAAALFYDRLFEREPELAPLFRGNMPHQGKQLMAMIGTAVQLLDKPEVLERSLRELGRRHAGYGVKGAHYAVVKGALLDTLATGLGPAFTAGTRQAWAAACDIIGTAMQAGAMASAA